MTVPTPTSTYALQVDAGNRAARSFLIGLVIDVTLSVILVLLTFFGNANEWGEIQWALLSYSVVKSIVQSGGSYVLRRFLDNSPIPTPTPPTEEDLTE